MEIPKLKDWVKYEAGLCKSCVATCCFLTMRVGVSEIIRLGLLKIEDKEMSPIKILQTLNEQLISYRPADKTFEIRRRSNGACYFLSEDRQCTVYENRPDGCRNFPLSGGIKRGFCPMKKL